MLKQGILIFACGHPFYGRMAYNLALTIKAVENIPIAVVCTPHSISHVGNSQRAVFDYVIDCPVDVPVGCGCKLWANDLTPFEETLLFDADMLWLPNKKPSQLFDQMTGVDFTAITEGYYDCTENKQHDINTKYFFWADCEEIKTKFKTKSDKIYQWRSEVVFFRKNKQTNQVFNSAKRIYRKPNLETMMKYAGGVADELAINISAAIHDVHPHRFKWQPSFWFMQHGGNIPTLEYLYANYSLVSFGSNFASGSAKQLYNRIVKAACYKMGHQHVFPLVSKNEWLPDRKIN